MPYVSSGLQGCMMFADCPLTREFLSKPAGGGGAGGTLLWLATGGASAGGGGAVLGTAAAAAVAAHLAQSAVDLAATGALLVPAAS